LFCLICNFFCDIAVSGRQHDDATINRFLAATDAVLKGSDPVLCLMDKRVRDIFKTACTFEVRVNDQRTTAVPQAMHSGVQWKPSATQSATRKDLFVAEVTAKATKIGFGVVADDLLEVTFDAFKVVDHCIKVHEEEVFAPIADQLQAQND
jgi:hypothetical protein